MDDINLFFRPLALSQVALFAAVVLVRERHTNGLLVALCGVACCGYLMLPFATEWPAPVTLATSALANAIPSLLWLLVYRWFQDRDDVPWWWIGLTPAYVSTMSVRVTGLLVQPYRRNSSRYGLPLSS